MLSPVPVIVARDLVRKGYAVFPVWDKRPLTPHGVHSAARTLLEFGRLNWLGANGVGVATGSVSGIDVLDVDLRLPQEGQEKSSSMNGVPVNGLAALAALPPLPQTRAAFTPNGGRHYWFKHVAGSRNRTNLAPGLEWFSDGKLIVVPPAPEREWITDPDAEIADAPDWLREMALGPPKRDAKNEEGEEISSGLLMAGTNSTSKLPKETYFLIADLMPFASRRQQRWVGAIWRMLADQTSNRNAALNLAAWYFRAVIKEGATFPKTACCILITACQRNGYLAKDGPEAVKATIISGLGITERDYPTPQAFELITKRKPKGLT